MEDANEMNEANPQAPIPPIQLGGIEPHASLLMQPPTGQILYKLMTIENLLRSIDSAYLYFNRVDQYVDSHIADKCDGQQLPADLDGNKAARFQKSPGFSAADYYDRSRSRTYACCFGLENADYLWQHYGNGGKHGKVCVVFSFERLRATLNHNLAPDKSFLEFDGIPCDQMLSLNYGIVQYVDRDLHQANGEQLPNPIIYSYLKDRRFDPEKELRVTLSAPGIFAGFSLADGRLIDFPSGLQAPFDFRAAFVDGTVVQLLISQDSTASYIQAELEKRGIEPAPGSGLTETAAGCITG